MPDPGSSLKSTIPSAAEASSLVFLTECHDANIRPFDGLIVFCLKYACSHIHRGRRGIEDDGKLLRALIILCDIEMMRSLVAQRVNGLYVDTGVLFLPGM